MTKVEIDQSVMNELLMFSAHELRRQRRGRIFSKGLKWVGFGGILVACYFAGGTMNASDNSNPNEPHVAFVNIFGPVMTGGDADSDRVIPALEKAFHEPMAKTVVLRINSPGGSPVHAGRIYNEVQALRKAHPDKHVYAVIEDLGASAAYWIASSAEQIYVDPASTVGSIGVISEGFGYTDIMSKIGIERRVMTSGKNKALLDPYSPVTPEIQTYWKGMLSEIHGQFIEAVKAGRGDRLHDADNPDLYTGLVWTGKKSIELGLADKLGSISTISRDEFGKVNAVDYTPPPDFFRAISGRAHAEFASFMSHTRYPSYY